MVVTRFHPSWSWSIKLVQFHTGMVWPGIKMIQTEYRLVSVGVSVGPAYFLQKHAKARFKHAWAVWKAPQKKERKKERKKVKPYLKLMASVHLNMDYGVSVLGGPLSVMQVSWAASKFKATSYYSVHPIILSATHMCIKPVGSLSGKTLNSFVPFRYFIFAVILTPEKKAPRCKRWCWCSAVGSDELCTCWISMAFCDACPDAPGDASKTIFWDGP